MEDTEKGVYICRDKLDVPDEDYESFKDYFLNKYSFVTQRDFVSRDLDKAENEMKKRIKQSLSEYFKKERGEKQLLS